MQRWALLVAGTILAVVSEASAAPTSDVVLAREKMKEGVAAANADDWERARINFAEAYRLYSRPSVLFNLAGAQLKTGHVRAGIESYKKVLAQPNELTAQQLTLAESALRAAEPRLAHVTLRTENAGCTTTLDDEPFGADAQEQAVDAGPHQAMLVCRGAVADQRAFTIGEGERRVVQLRAPAPPPVSAPVRMPAPESPRSSVVPVVGWALAGTAVAAFGTSAITGVIGLGDLAELKDTCAKTATCSPTKVEEMRTLLGVSDVALGIGVVCAAGAIYALLVHPRITRSNAGGLAPFTFRF